MPGTRPIVLTGPHASCSVVHMRSTSATIRSLAKYAEADRAKRAEKAAKAAAHEIQRVFTPRHQGALVHVLCHCGWSSNAYVKSSRHLALAEHTGHQLASTGRTGAEAAIGLAL